MNKSKLTRVYNVIFYMFVYFAVLALYCKITFVSNLITLNDKIGIFLCIGLILSAVITLLLHHLFEHLCSREQ